MLRSQPSSTSIAFFEPMGWFAPIGLAIFCTVCVAAGLWFAFLAQDMKLEGPVGLGLGAFLLFIVLVFAWNALTQGWKWFSRMGVTVDRAEGTVESWWGILFAFPCAKKPLEAFSRLYLGKEITEYQTRSGTRIEIEYQLFLVGAVGDPLMVGRHEDYGALRVVAEQLGQFLKMDVVDDGQGNTQLLTCDLLCRPAWERDPISLAEYQPPLSTPEIKCLAKDGHLHVDFPDSGNMGCLLCGMIPAGLLASVIVYIYLDSSGKAWIPMLIFGGIGLFILACIFSLFLPNRVSVDVNRDELVYSHSGLVFTSTTRIPAIDIWEVRHDLLGLRLITTQGVFDLPTGEADMGIVERVRKGVLRHLSGK